MLRRMKTYVMLQTKKYSKDNANSHFNNVIIFHRSQPSIERNQIYNIARVFIQQQEHSLQSKAYSQRDKSRKRASSHQITFVIHNKIQQ